MVEFQEDQIFKNIAEEDVKVLLEITNKKSKTKKIWAKSKRNITKELLSREKNVYNLN